MVTAKTVENHRVKLQHRVYARAMRHIPSDAEKKFWWCVRDRRLAGHKFKRQVLMGPYIADFACIERQLIVELDGGQHADNRAYGAKRDAFLASKGFRVIRIDNIDVLKNIESVMDFVVRALEGTPSP